MSERLQIIVWLVGQWQTFHRRPMLEALAQNARDLADVVCVNPPVSWRELGVRHRRTTLRPLVDAPVPNVSLLTPVLWLPFLGRFQRLAPLECRIVGAQTRRHLRGLASGGGPRVAWIYRPEQLDRLDLAGEDYLVYECYDAYALSIRDGTAIPGIAEREKTLLERADLVFATSQELLTHCQGHHGNVHLAPNGVDLALFTQRPGSAPTEMGRIPQPRIGYVGSITEFLDLALVERVATLVESCSFVLMGPIDEAVKRQANSLQRKHKNIHFLGRKPYHKLPAYLHACDVIMLPFRNNAYLNHSSPLVLWECLATGKPIVMTRLGIVAGLVGVLSVADDADAFAHHVRRALDGRSPEQQRRQVEIAASHSWQALTRRMLKNLEASVAG
jgi:glycosyltransferase involved in cell wall biosynthesis